MFVRAWVWIEGNVRRVTPDRGQDVVEYALLCGLITLATLVLLILVGPAVKNTFQWVVNGLQSA